MALPVLFEGARRDMPWLLWLCLLNIMGGRSSTHQLPQNSSATVDSDISHHGATYPLGLRPVNSSIKPVHAVDRTAVATTVHPHRAAPRPAVRTPR
ncbi:hypothetical protein AB0H77_29850 [Streptomyces sp. NPDC050844]|uniref:hypothetical protein n=1 Tax=Streptomyces sp. NPDC050844 TaxID=3155790 RepID=UPI0033C6D563